jgi:predicted ester cyclase
VLEFLSSFADLQHRVEDMIAEGDQVAVRFSARGTHTGQWMQFKPSNKLIHYTGVTVARVENGKIAQHQTWWDKADLMGQLESES